MAATRATGTRRQEPATPTSKSSSAATQSQHSWHMRRIRSLVGAAFGAVALLLGFVNDVGGVRSWLQSYRAPDAEIKYFEMKDGGYQLIDPTQVVLHPKYEEVSKGYLSVPLNLAVRNKEARPLEAVRVEISYPEGLKILPAGNPKIDPHNRVLIYEHDIEDIQAVDNYTPLKTIDTIYIPYYFDHSTGIHINPDGGVAELSLSVTGTKTRYSPLELGVRVYSRDRPTLSQKVGFNARESTPPSKKQKTIRGKPTGQEKDLFREVARQAAHAPNKWVGRDMKKSHKLMYRHVNHEGGTFGVLLVDNTVNYIIADLDGNGFVDYIIEDTADPGRPDRKFTPLGPEPMVDLQRPRDIKVGIPPP
jgi:hypothetical protein